MSSAQNNHSSYNKEKYCVFDPKTIFVQQVFIFAKHCTQTGVKVFWSFRRIFIKMEHCCDASYERKSVQKTQALRKIQFMWPLLCIKKLCKKVLVRFNMPQSHFLP